MTLTSELRTFVAALHEMGKPGLAGDLAALTNRVASLEKAWDEVIADAQESADAAERHARLHGDVVVPFARPRLVGVTPDGG